MQALSTITAGNFTNDHLATPEKVIAWLERDFFHQ
jgi:hypothetical protein